MAAASFGEIKKEQWNLADASNPFGSDAGDRMVLHASGNKRRDTDQYLYHWCRNAGGFSGCNGCGTVSKTEPVGIYWCGDLYHCVTGDDTDHGGIAGSVSSGTMSDIEQKLS